MTLVLPIELTNGNEGRTKHWAPAHKRRQQYELTIRSEYPHPKPVKTPVKLTVTRVLGKRQRRYDADSLGRGNAKEIIDALVAVGFLPDDGPKHVREVTYRQDDKTRPEKSVTVIEMEPIP